MIHSAVAGKLAEATSARTEVLLHCFDEERSDRFDADTIKDESLRPFKGRVRNLSVLENALLYTSFDCVQCVEEGAAITSAYFLDSDIFASHRSASYEANDSSYRIGSHRIACT